jgi:sugar phosphate isomerase/epimerase
MRFAYVLPDPASYADWAEFDGDLDSVKQAGYDAVELQIAEPAEFDEERVRKSLLAAGLPMCAFQTGASCGSPGYDAAVAARLRRAGGVRRLGC